MTDDEIMDAKAIIDRVGIGCEPASAATLAGIRKLRQQGMLSADAHVIGILTGHVLKDGDATVKYHFDDFDGGARPLANRPISIPASLTALERVLDDALHG